METGEVYYHTEFPFSDKTVGKKLFIVVYSSSNTILVCKTTSKEKPFYREKIPGCNAKKNYFMLFANEDGFKKNTWVDLRVIEFEKLSLLKIKLERNSLKQVNKLKNNTIKKILECIILSEDVSNMFKTSIKKSLESLYKKTKK